MRYALAFSLALSGISANAVAAVSSEEAAQLGKALTLFGAEQAGNEAGTIPPYEGGLRTAPAGFEPGSGYWVNPYKDEEPLFRIDSSNYQEHADKLSAGQLELLKRNPDYYLDIFPSHRTAALPQDVLDATVRNATTCETLNNGLTLSPECRGGVPFPIPKTGHEVMWNQQVRYNDGKYGTTTSSSNSWLVASNGAVTKASEQATFVERPYYQDDVEGRDPQMYSRVYSVTKEPARRAGELTGYMDYLDPAQQPRRAGATRLVSAASSWPLSLPTTRQLPVWAVWNCSMSFSCSQVCRTASSSSWSAKKRCTSRITAMSCTSTVILKLN